MDRIALSNVAFEGDNNAYLFADGRETTLVDPGSIAAAGYRRAWPGHREPIEDPAARAEDIVRHHEERAWRVLDALCRRGPSDPWTVSADLFGDLAVGRCGTKLGESPENILLAACPGS
ncbi:MAG: hypothetical protein V5A39_10770 [Haloarculaceae archaeon]